MKQRAITVLFWLLVAFTLIEALIPSRRSLHLFASDKLEHGLAFAVLALAATFAFPRLNTLWLAIGLMALGAAIELMQALPFIGRDSDLRDWIADSIAVIVVLGAVEICRRFASVR